MPITKEQIEQFNKSPFPTSVIFTEKSVGNFFGKEAVLTRVGDQAFKWYASLTGKSPTELTQYGNQINQDEACLQSLGLSKNQIPDSHFFIGQYPSGNAELFAIQPWSNGIPLRDIPTGEIIRNKNLRHNIGNFFISCAKRYDLDRQTVDLTGGTRLSWLGKEFVDPLVFINPFRTTNVLIDQDIPILVDAKANTPTAHPIIRKAVIAQMHLAKLIGHGLLRT